MQMKRLMMMLALVAALTACSSDDGDDGPQTINRTVLVYMAAENRLSDYTYSDLWQMKEGSRHIGNSDALLVYVDRSETTELPWLARIRNGQLTDSVSLKNMGISTKNEYASDPDIMRQVLRYAFDRYPAQQDYGLVLWGHSDGWLIEADSIASRRAYGVDNGENSKISDIGKWLNVPSLERVLATIPHLKFIMADCCNFMCLESLYELRKVTDYIIGSTSEIPGCGAPYDTVVPALFSTADDFYRTVVDNYFAQQVYSYELNKELTQPLSVVKTSQMEALAAATRTVLHSIDQSLGGDYANLSGLIHYYNYYKPSFRPEYNIFYDAGDYVKRYASDAEYQTWLQALNQAVVYRKYTNMWTTDKPWSSHYSDFQMSEDRYHGVSMFIPQDPTKGYYAGYNENIKKLAWYAAVGH
jgi:hypothetical protein